MTKVTIEQFLEEKLVEVTYEEIQENAVQYNALNALVKDAINVLDEEIKWAVEIKEIQPGVINEFYMVISDYIQLSKHYLNVPVSAKLMEFFNSYQFIGYMDKVYDCTKDIRHGDMGGYVDIIQPKIKFLEKLIVKF